MKKSMKGKKRFEFLCIVLTTVFAIISSNFMLPYLQQEMIKQYETKKQKCKELKDIAKVVQEGKGIDIKKIPEGIQYRIYGSNENIIFYYCLDNNYTATITLSKDCEILKTEYSTVVENYDDYKYEVKCLSVICCISFIFCFYFLLVIIIQKYSDRKTEQLYRVRCQTSNQKQLMSAKEIYEQVMCEPKDWGISVRELVRICKEPKFPYGTDIKVKILESFTNIEKIGNLGGTRYGYDMDVAEYCYNSLSEIESEKVKNARKNYLSEIIKRASYVSYFDRNYHQGPAYQNICENWCAQKMEELAKRQLSHSIFNELESDFANIIKKAEEDGLFEEDDKKRRSAWKFFYQRMNSLEDD